MAPTTLTTRRTDIRYAKPNQTGHGISMRLSKTQAQCMPTSRCHPRVGAVSRCRDSGRRYPRKYLSNSRRHGPMCIHYLSSRLASLKCDGEAREPNGGAERKGAGRSPLAPGASARNTLTTRHVYICTGVKRASKAPRPAIPSRP